MKHIATLATGVATIAACGVAATGVLAGNEAPSGPSGVHITALSHGTIGSRVDADTAGIEIETRGPRDMLVTSITLDRRGTFGWHTHPGPVLVAVSKGTLVLYRGEGSRCVRSTVKAGQAFVEGGGDVHLGRNEGSGHVELNAIFLGRVGTTSFLEPAPRPKACHV
jgi:quercetin dioxygenase-like cupin family protein